MLGTSLVVLEDVVWGVGMTGVGESKQVACNIGVGVGGDRMNVGPTQHRSVVPTPKGLAEEGHRLSAS